MQNLTEHIEEIENKVRRVLQKIEELKEENSVLKQKNNRLLIQLEELSQNQEMQQIISPPTLPVKENKREDIEGIKKELDHYIQEIDQTIQLLAS